MEYVYIEFLIEDKSGEIILEEIMKKYISSIPNNYHIDYKIHGFKGIGRIPKLEKVSLVKTKRLLNDLPMYLKGMDASLNKMPYKKAVFVIIDADDNNCVNLKQNLVNMYEKLDIKTEVFFCIAIEEIEAWLLGDKEALLKAYPSAKKNILQRYIQDSICDTWEILADVVYRGGVNKLKKDANSYYEIGKFKCECAKNIAKELNINKNLSESFKYFIKKLNFLVFK